MGPVQANAPLTATKLTVPPGNGFPWNSTFPLTSVCSTDRGLPLPQPADRINNPSNSPPQARRKIAVSVPRFLEEIMKMLPNLASGERTLPDTLHQRVAASARQVLAPCYQSGPRTSPP